MPVAPPNRIAGCLTLVVGGLFAGLASLFLVVAVLALAGIIPMQMNGPAWLFIAVPLVHLAVGLALLRLGWVNLTRPTPEPSPEAPGVNRAELTRAVVTILVGFFVAGGLGVLGAALAVPVFGGPVWLAPFLFFAPLAVFFSVMQFRFRSLVARLVRAVPSPESAAAAPPAARQAVIVPPGRGEPVPMTGDWPTVPTVETKPGRVLAHALETVGLPAGCKFGCAVFFALLWNGILSVFVVPVIDQLRLGQRPDWWNVAFLVPFVLVGLGLVVVAVLTGLRWVLSLLVGRIAVEVSAHPLVPGGKYELHAAQTGWLGLGGVAVELVCEEAATYVAGTSKQTARRVVARHPVADPAGEGGSLPLTVQAEVPAGAMHSFAAPNNKVIWKVRVAGRALGVVPFAEEFLVAVRPG